VSLRYAQQAALSTENVKGRDLQKLNLGATYTNAPDRRVEELSKSRLNAVTFTTNHTFTNSTVINSTLAKHSDSNIVAQQHGLNLSLCSSKPNGRMSNSEKVD
jgi:hypothetical protein